MDIYNYIYNYIYKYFSIFLIFKKNKFENSHSTNRQKILFSTNLNTMIFII